MSARRQPDLQSTVIEGAVYVNDHDLGAGTFGLVPVAGPAGVSLWFAAADRGHLVEVVVTAAAAVEVGRALAELGAHQLHCEKAAKN